MAEKRGCFTSAMMLSKMGITCVPDRYILPLPQRPNFNQEPNCVTDDVPVIDLSLMENPSLRSRVMDQIRAACKELGIFQVINHGISSTFTQDALDAAEEFFNLPNETKRCFASTDINEPVRYGTSMNHIKDKVQYWRDFIKHYANPLSTWIDLWPSYPPTYKKKMGNYAKALHVLHKRLMETVIGSLGLRPDYLHEDLEQNSQVMAINYYPACPEPDLALGLPPHSDFGLLTIILQDDNGLEIMNRKGKWQPASELVDDDHPLSYKEGSFRDFLQFISARDVR